jgi:AraC family transcriptional regulator
MTSAVPIRGTHGSVRAHFAAGPFTARIVEHAPNSRLPRHAHDVANVTLVLAGAVSESVARRELEYHSGMLFFRPPAEAHSNRYAASGSRSLILDVTPNAYAANRKVGRLFDSFAVTRDDAASRAARRIVREMFEPDDCSAIAIEGLVLEMFASAARHFHTVYRHVPWFDRAIEFLEAERVSRIGLGQLAFVAGVSPDRLVREFRRRLGVTPGAFQRILRVEWAAHELLRSDKSIARIATEAGFTDQSHLTRVFVRHIGCAPGAYRKRSSSG